ncbi:MAG TPA: hypothetical protein VGZ00_00940 [Candidatus Baltobacteraceae bacterium]|jgi:hypothetical protein|nr:hypothetical protein [Candidatus Baltobacteraceae bacterium]
MSTTQTNQTKAQPGASATSQSGAQIQLVIPDLFQVSGDGLHITYLTQVAGGKPQLVYQDATQRLVFNGDEITRAESELGTTLSVFLRRTVDAGSTTFTLLLPRVNLRARESVPINTFGITTVHRFSLVPILDYGQLDTYRVEQLRGTASNVILAQAATQN